MKKLRWRDHILGALILAVAALPSAARAQLSNTFGEVIPLPGQINEIVIDDARGLIYAGNFSAGRVEVVDAATHQILTRFPAGPQPGGVTGMAISPDRRFLVVTTVAVSQTAPALSGVTVINLNSPSERENFTLTEQPLAVAFTKSGEALIVTTNSFLMFEPEDGAFRTVLDFANPAGGLVLPAQAATFPQEIVNASIAASRDGNWIFGLTDSFVFSFAPFQGSGLTRVRPLNTLVNPPNFSEVTASFDGSSFLAGQLLFNRQLRVIADPPQADAGQEGRIIGGHFIDSEADTVYGGFLSLAEIGSPGPAFGGVLDILDADNLLPRNRIRLPESITGRVAADQNVENLYAISDSGLLHLPVGELSEAPQISFAPGSLATVFEFGTCNRNAVTRMIRVESGGGQPAQFSLTAAPAGANGASAVLFEPANGTTPADVRVTVNPSAVGNAQGTAQFRIQTESNAVNIPREPLLVANVRDVDQKGTIHTLPGQFVDVIGDPVRNRVYALDQESFQVFVLDEEFRVTASFRTGNTPTWMAVTRDGRFLYVANSRSESVSIVDLNTLQSQPPLFLPWETLGEGHYPVSLAADNAQVLFAAASASAFGRIGTINPFNRGVSIPETLGNFVNQVDPATALVPTPNGAGVFVAESNGTVGLWETSSAKLIFSRNDFASLSGAVGAGPNFFVADNNVLNASLKPIAEFNDAAGGQVSSGFTWVEASNQGVRTTRAAGNFGSGALQTIAPADPTRLRASFRPAATPSPATEFFPFTRTVAALRNGQLAVISNAGVVELEKNFDSGRQLPRVSAVTNAADFGTNLGAGGLISIFGENFASRSAQAADMPLPTELAETCVTVNGAPLPLLFVSGDQINAQLTFNLTGPAETVVHTPGGLSNPFIAEVSSSSPAVFQVRGPDNSDFDAIVRAENNQLSTLSNPMRPNEVAVIYTTGLGLVQPLATAGFPASDAPLQRTLETPQVFIGDLPGIVQFSGLTPGFVGLYQINVLFPADVPLGLQVPVTVLTSGGTEQFNVRIVD